MDNSGLNDAKIVEEVPLKWIDRPCATEFDKIPSATKMDEI